MDRTIPLYTLDGVQQAEKSTHYFSTADMLGLSMLRFFRHDSDDVVLIIHGLTTSSDMFIMPEHDNLVNYLLDQGYGDVWTLDFRMSNRHGYNMTRHRYNLDDCALYDFPAALKALRGHIGDRRVHVICHCLGSVSFMMSLFGKQVEGISSVIANSVSLRPNIPLWSRMKLSVGPFVVENLMSQAYTSPSWSREKGLSIGKLFAKTVSLFHRECDVPECHMLSFIWGSGWPALYEHENLDPITHQRGGDLYGPTGMNYYRHVHKMIKGKRAVKYRPRDSRYQDLPDDYLEHAEAIETPVLFMTGENNRVFSDSNILAYNTLEEKVPGRHELHVFPGYGHQDVFMGKNVARDIFPRLLQFLQKHSQ